MTGERLNADVGQYWRAAARNAAPSPIPSDPLSGGATPIEQVLRVLGLAANSGDPHDIADSAEEHARRDAITIAAAERFAADDGESAATMNGVAAGDQQIPQLAAGIAATVAGVAGGVGQSVGQFPQQVAQAAQQSLQAGLGSVLSLGRQAGDAETDDGLGTAPPAEELDGPGDFDVTAGAGLSGAAEPGGAAIGSGFGATTPAAPLGPPAVPSAATSPASAPSAPASPATAATPFVSGGAGMAGMPMVPPGAVSGTVGADRDGGAATKRISVKPVRNGSPVQGRITVPPAEPGVTAKVEGKPVATRRIAPPAALGDR